MSPVLALILTYIIWGAAPPIFKYALEGIPPFTLAFIRFFFAALIFIPLARKHWQTVEKKEYRDIIIGSFFGITINISFFFLGLEYAPSINVNVIGALGPLFLYFLSIYILNEKPHPQIIKGMVVSLLGILVIILMPLMSQKEVAGATGETNSLELLGNLFFVIATLGGVLHSIHNKRVLKKVNVYVVTFISFAFSSVTFLPLMFYEIAAGKLQPFGLNGWVGIIYGVVLCSAAAYYLFSYGMSKMSAQEVGVFSYISPIVAVLVAIPLLGEYPDIYFVIGACLVFIGILISERHPHYRSAPKKLHK